MLFEIDFNTETDDITLETIGAVLVPTGSNKYPPFERYCVDLSDFSELENIINKVDKLKGGDWSAIISFDPPTIFLDKDI